MVEWWQQALRRELCLRALTTQKKKASIVTLQENIDSLGGVLGTSDKWNECRIVRFYSLALYCHSHRLNEDLTIRHLRVLNGLFRRLSCFHWSDYLKM